MDLREEAERVSKNEAELQAVALEALADWALRSASRIRNDPDASCSTGDLSSQSHNIIRREGVRSFAWRLCKRITAR